MWNNCSLTTLNAGKEDLTGQDTIFLSQLLAISHAEPGADPPGQAGCLADPEQRSQRPKRTSPSPRDAEQRPTRRTDRARVLPAWGLGVNIVYQSAMYASHTTQP